MEELAHMSSSIHDASRLDHALELRRELLDERGAMPPVITRASVVGTDRSRALFDAAYREHARRIARAIAGEES